MKKRTLYMGTTPIEAQRTAGEIISELVRGGATSINTEYANGNVSGIKWVMKVNGHDTLFDMPVRIDPVKKFIRDPEQARRTAWRHLLRWVQIQNAMIETGMVQPAEVYFAYIVPVGETQTLFSIMSESKFKQLEAPKNQ